MSCGRADRPSKGLVEELRMLIDEYLDSRMKSLRQLARECHVSYSTLRRIMQSECIPDLIAVIRVLHVVCEPSHARSFLSQHYQGAFDIFQGAFSHKPELSELSCYIDSQMAYKMFEMMAQDPSCTRQHIVKAFGEFGSQKLDELMDGGYVGEDGHGYLCFLPMTVEQDACMCLRNIRLLAQMFDGKNLGTDAALAALYSQSIAREGLTKIKKYGMEYQNRLRQIIAEHDGDIAVYVGWMHAVSDVKEGVVL